MLQASASFRHLMASYVKLHKYVYGIYSVQHSKIFSEALIRKLVRYKLKPRDVRRSSPADFSLPKKSTTTNVDIHSRCCTTPLRLAVTTSKMGALLECLVIRQMDQPTRVLGSALHQDRRFGFLNRILASGFDGCSLLAQKPELQSAIEPWRPRAPFPQAESEATP